MQPCGPVVGVGVLVGPEQEAGQVFVPLLQLLLSDAEQEYVAAPVVQVLRPDWPKLSVQVSYALVTPQICISAHLVQSVAHAGLGVGVMVGVGVGVLVGPPQVTVGWLEEALYTPFASTACTHAL